MSVKQPHAGFVDRLRTRTLQFISAITILLAVIASLSGAARAAELAGATSGELGVSPAGGAGYSIPISVPPGTTGMQPSLTLQYSSQAGNGIMGVGWSVGGLSSITRCGTDIHNDQNIDPVDFETDDKFCLNGERLVPVSGTNGADGTEYRTQQEEFSRVFSYGTAGTGPEWFKVHKKSGQIFEYGNTVDSRVEATGRSEARAWMLNRISDQRGNYIHFRYNEDTATGKLRPGEVLYTGNDAQGLVPYNSVVFDYEARPDISKTYLAGSVIEQEKRLRGVKVLSGTTQVRSYQVAYEVSATGRSRPTSVTECGVGGTDCFAPTVFEWSADGTYDLSNFALGTNEGLTSSSYDEGRIVASGDFNNDGLTDFYIARVTSEARKKAYGSNKDKVWLSDGDGTFTKIWREHVDGLRNEQQVLATGDFDGDGNLDIYVVEVRGDGRIEDTGDGGYDADFIMFGDGTGNFNRVVINAIDLSVYNWNISGVGDFNGDGLTDLYLYGQDDKGRADGNEKDQVWLANRVGDNNVTFTKQEIDLANSIPREHEVVATGDFNGDGLIDLYTVVTDDKNAGAININGTPGADSVHLSNGSGGFVKQAVPDADRVPDEFAIMATGDFNGDGHTDLYLTEIDEHGHAEVYASDKVRLSRGDGTFINIDVPYASRLPDFHKVLSTGDFNGDGLTDFLAARTDDKGRLKSDSHSSDAIYYSDGKGGFVRTSLNSSSHGISNSSWDDYVVAATGDFNGDGLTDMYLWRGDDHQRSRSGSYWDNIIFSGWNPPDYLTRVTNGLGLWSEFQYKPMTDAAVYTVGTDASYPENDIITAGQMVHKVVADNGIGGTGPGSNTQTYTYAGFKAHIVGVGGLGFRTMQVTDDATGIVTESTYLQNWQTHHQGMLERSRTIAPGDIVLKDQQVTWAVRFRPGGGTDGVAQCFRYADTSTTTSRDLNGVLMSTVTETTTYDDYGYPTQLVASTSGAGGTFTKTTTNAYTHNASSWILGRLDTASVTHSATGQADITRTSGFTYEPTGEIRTETVNSASGLWVTKTNVYNPYGAVTDVTETWGEPSGSPADDGIVASSRTTSYTYDAKVRHQLTETNPLGHSETRTFDPVTGLIATATGPNGLTTSWTYNAFGQVTREDRADGTYTTTTREICAGATFWCPLGQGIRTTTSESAGGHGKVWSDRLLREKVKQVSQLVGQGWSAVHTEYDNLGRVSKKSEPRKTNAPMEDAKWTYITYDLLGRPVLTTRPDNSTQTVVYNGLTQLATNEIGQTKTVTKDAIGQTVSVTDNAGNVTTHVYDAIGQMSSMSGPNGNTSTYLYDDRGNKISDTDPDKGTWTYRYNALGMLVEQTDAKGQVTAMTYDVLGRMLTRIDDANSAGASARTATWTYDVGNKAIGKLTGSTSGNGYSSTATYDSLGRPLQATETIDGTAYTSTTVYDSFSRVDSVIYPSGVRTQNVYDAHGQLTEVRNYTSQLPYWQLLEMDARGNVTKERLGNGVETTRIYEDETGQLNQIISEKDLTTVQNLTYTLDDTGNLTQRHDGVQNLTENFAYDNLNRVIGISTTYGNGQAADSNVTMTYDAIGNITSKTGVGAYSYGQQHGTCSPDDQQAGPNAVTAVGPFQNTPVQGAQLSEVFAYTATDGNGGTSSSSLIIGLNGAASPLSAVSDTASVQEDATANGSGNVLTNDSGSGLVLAAVNATTVASVGTTAIAGTYGSLSVSANGAWSYVLDNANAAVDGLGDGQTLTEVFSYSVTGSGGGNAASTLTITVNGSSQVAAHNDTASIVEDTATPVTGNLVANDLGSGLGLTHIGSTAVPPSGTTAIVGTYGTLSVSADGAWSYALDNGNTALDYLDAGDSLSEVFAYTAGDANGGTASASLVITIDGQDDPGVTPVNLTDTLSGQVTATASSQFSGSYWVGRFIDNNTSTLFFTDNYYASEWANVDLGGDYLVARIELVASSMSNGAEVQVRDASGNVVHSFPAISGATDGDLITYTLSQPVMARSVRMVRPVVGMLGAYEIDVFGFIAGAAPPPPPPVAGADTASLPETATTAITGNVLANDTGSSLDLAHMRATPVAGSGTTSIAGAFGTITVSADGAWSYVLDSANTAVAALRNGETLADVFTYTATGTGSTATSSNLVITINGVTQAPSITTVADFAELQASTATAINGNVITNDLGSGLSLTSVGTTSVAANGDTTIAGTHGILTISADGSWSYTLNNTDNAAGTKTAVYCYDANGNQTSGDGRNITYSAFDKPTQILKGSNIVNIFYGPDRKRFKRQDLTSSGTTNTVYAMGGAYESIQRPDLTVEEKHYIGGFAVVSTYSNTTIASTRYLLKDHLGSLDTITDEAGAIVQKMSFDAWGKRREVDWTALSGSALLAFDTSITTRGYTGHEMLDPVGLVHMNGRVYDAELGRFLSADPNIQDVENFQNWNRYTYVLNNPLSYTDPSGFFFSKIFKAIGNFFKSVFKAIGSVFKALLKIPLIRSAIQIVACAPGPWAPATCAAAAIGLALAAGGSISDALLAGAMSIAQMGVWTAVGSAIMDLGVQAALGATSAAFAAVKGAIHGVVGGAISVAQGGNFMEGFAANAIGAAAGVMAQGGSFGFAGDGDPQGMFMRTAAAAAAGGAAAVAAGGKFANGALTAAMAHMYNQEQFGQDYLRQLKRGTKGHHRIPKELWSKNLSKAARDVFDKTFLGTTGPLPENWHRNDMYHREYTPAVRRLWRKFLSQPGVSQATMTNAQANYILSRVMNSNAPAITRYNHHVMVGRNLHVMYRGRMPSKTWNSKQWFNWSMRAARGSD